MNILLKPAVRELSASEVRAVCDPSLFNFETTADLSPAPTIIGQPRAVEALDFGVDIAAYGFNVFALGLPGTGRTTLIRQFLERKAAGEPAPDDWCYINNFADLHRPQALRLPPGKGVQLRKDMADLVTHLQQALPRAFESEDVQRQRDEIINDVQARQTAEFNKLEERVKERGFVLRKTPSGLALAPAMDGQVISERQLEKLGDEQREKLAKIRNGLEKEIERVLRAIREMEKEGREQLAELERRVALFVVEHPIKELQEKYASLDPVVAYLERVQADIVEHVEAFKKGAEGNQMPFPIPIPVETAFTRYGVNVLVDNANTSGAPVVLETNPTYNHLIGRIEHQAMFGALVTNYTMLKPGALHRANGGYLILNVRDLLLSPFAWDALKRALKDRQVRIEELGEQFSLVSTVTLQPEPIPLDVKVVLIGHPLLYYLLHYYDEDFPKLFKVKADFTTRMDRTPESNCDYALFIQTICREENLPPFDRGGVAKVIEYSSRLVEDQGKLSTRFGEIADLVREAVYWARRDGRAVVTAQDVQRAVEAKVYRSNAVEERIQELIKQGTLLIDIDGEAVGQVNGLSVIDLGDYTFSRPSRVTARTFMGRGGVIDIEREAKLGGRVHSKGVLTLAGYLGGQYAQDAPLNLSASLTFEQSYEEVEGDSASSTELFALLSSLSGFPLKQGIAVTGSVNQHGQIQPVGGITAKVEGFFDVCKARGLTGEQGVLIPAGNVRHLMLREDVVAAIAAGQFHVWAVNTVDEGIGLLTGREAGSRQPDGTFPEDTVHGAVVRQLKAWAEKWREQTAEERKGTKGNSEELKGT